MIFSGRLFYCFVSVVVCMFSTVPAHAGRTASIDSTYVQVYDSRYVGKLFIKDNFISVIREHEGVETTYKTNRPLALGAGFYYKGIGLSVSYGFNFLSDSEKGKTESLDFQYSFFGKSFVVDVIAQSHKGFYIDDRGYAPYHEVFPDMRVCRAGVDYMHIFSPEKFSFKSAFGNSEKQLRSAGTWALFMNYRNNIKFPMVENSERVGVSSGVVSAGAVFRM